MESLRLKLAALEAAFESTLALSAQIDDPEAREMLADLRSAHGHIQNAKRRRRPQQGAAPPTPQQQAPMEVEPPATPSAFDPGWDAEMDALDKEEREERELAARRAQFALGAADDFEDLDWTVAGGAGSDDEGGGNDRDAEAAARRLLANASADADLSAEAAAHEPTWAELDGFVPPGREGFIAFAQAQMRLAGVPSNPRVVPADELEPAAWAAGPVKPKLQPYQETVAYLCRPQSLPNPRMLVVHRTGSGKTATMIQIADNYFNDRRPKLIVFPTTAVCNSFYRELRNPHFPNRYADYLAKGHFPDAKKALELTGILRNGCVLPEFLHAADLPSAPLRAFSYTQAGGAASCGQRPNAVFKCPDGYAGSFPERLPPQGGYPDFECKYNPFSNKIILMDEVHNLVRPSAEILRNERRMLMLQRLRQLLRTAENSVIIGLSGTPLCDVPAEAQALQNLIKGRHHQQLNDEGFVSYYMQTPLSVFPSVTPTPLPKALPNTALRRVPLRNLPAPPPPEGGGRRRLPPPPAGNRKEYEAKVGDEDVASLDPIRLSVLSRLCSVGQTAGYAGRDDVARMVHGARGKLLKRDLGEDAFGSEAQLQRARGYCSKLHRIVEDVAALYASGGAGSAVGDAATDATAAAAASSSSTGGAVTPPPPASSSSKTLVIIHRNAGYKLLLRMLARRLGEGSVRGFPAARTYAEKRDSTLAPLLGFPHDEARGRSGGCPCALCSFNRGDDGVRVMVADAKECGEGVSFFGVRKLLLADVPSTAEDMLQRVGRAVRFMGHSALPADERSVDVKLYVATVKEGTTVDEVMIERLKGDLTKYAPELKKLRAKAVDAGMWEGEEEDDDEQEKQEQEQEGGEAEAAAAAAGGAEGEMICGDVLSESEDEVAPAEPAPVLEPPTPKARKPRKQPASKAKVVKQEEEDVEEAAAAAAAAAVPSVPMAPMMGADDDGGVEMDAVDDAGSLDDISDALSSLKVTVEDGQGGGGGAGGVGDKENAVQKKSPARKSPAKGLSPSKGLSPAVGLSPARRLVASPAAAPPAAPPAAAAPAKASTKKTPAAAAKGGGKARRPAAAKRMVKDAKRSDDESGADSDMDGWIAASDEESEEEGGGSAASSDEASGSSSASDWSADDGSEEESEEEYDGASSGSEEEEKGEKEQKEGGEAGEEKEAAAPPPPPPPPPPKAKDESDDDIFCSEPEEAATPTAARRRLVKAKEAAA